jgi:hypothetical protein
VARPSKYDWDGIKEAYEGGLDKADICKMYKLPNKLLGNKILTDKWVVKGNLKADVEGFYAQTHKMAQNIEKLHPINQELMIKKLDTLEQDNELIGNNRKIAKMLQGVIVANRQDINLSNIRNVSGVMKDIESIANPKPEAVINNTNAQQNNTPTQINIMRDDD